MIAQAQCKSYAEEYQQPGICRRKFYSAGIGLDNHFPKLRRAPPKWPILLSRDQRYLVPFHSRFAV